MRTTKIKNKFLKKNNFKSILNIDFRYKSVSCLRHKQLRMVNKTELSLPFKATLGLYI